MLLWRRIPSTPGNMPMLWCSVNTRGLRVIFQATKNYLRRINKFYSTLIHLLINLKATLKLRGHFSPSSSLHTNYTVYSRWHRAAQRSSFHYKLYFAIVLDLSITNHAPREQFPLWELLLRAEPNSQCKWCWCVCVPKPCIPWIALKSSRDIHSAPQRWVLHQCWTSLVVSVCSDHTHTNSRLWTQGVAATVHHQPKCHPLASLLPVPYSQTCPLATMKLIRFSS